MRKNSLHGNRETSSTSAGSAGDRLEKAKRRTSSMHVGGESDGCIVPKKSANNVAIPAATEKMVGRQPTRGNTPKTTTLRTQSRGGVSDNLKRVREAAHRDRCAKFTALMHHITVNLLRDSCFALTRIAASGVDQVTWHAYGDDLENHLMDLAAWQSPFTSRMKKLQ